MIRYYCSGFDVNNAFRHGLGEMFKTELKTTKNIVYIPGGADKLEKVKNKYVPLFTEHFRNVGIVFENINIITPELEVNRAKEMIDNADFIMLMGGCPFKQKELCKNLHILDNLKNYKGLMLGFSAGAMLMSKYIIITPCSEEYPEILNIGDETYKKEDLLKVAKEFGEYYLLQDNLNIDNQYDVSLIKSVNGNIEFYKENNGKIWIVSDTVALDKNKSLNR